MCFIPSTSNVTSSRPSTSNVTSSCPSTSNVTSSRPSTSNVTSSRPSTSNVTSSRPPTSNVTSSRPSTSNVTSSRPSTSNVLLNVCFQSLLNVLRESHRTRTVFRKVGGFVYVMSVLVIMEGCLSDPPRAPWDKG